MTSDVAAVKRSFSERMLDGVERVGNKVPHPVLMFLYLILFIIVLSHILYLVGVSATEEIAVAVPSEEMIDEHGGLGGSDVPYPETPDLGNYDPEYEIVTETIPVVSLLTVDGIRFIFTSFVDNFAGFAVVAVVFVAMMGVGVAEHAGMMGALIRKLVAVAPRRLIAFILIFVGVLSSIASDAGYLILIPLSAAAFMTLGRHPLAGMAAAFAGVGAIFAVNLLITPIDSMITEISNEAIALAGAEPLTVVANYFFSVVSSIVIAIVAWWVTVKLVEPRLGPYDVTEASLDYGQDEGVDQEAEARGLRMALYGALGVVGDRRHPHHPQLGAATPSGDRTGHREHPLHGQPDLHHHADLPRRRGLLREGGEDTVRKQRCHRWGDQDVRRLVRPGLHAADDQPVHRLFQLHEHAPGCRHRDGPHAWRQHRSDPFLCWWHSSW